MNFVVDGTVAALVAILVQMLLKPLIEVWLKPTAPNHDTVIRATALLLGVALLAVTTLVGGPWPANGNAWLLLFGSGAMSGLVAIGGYHAFTGSATPANAVTVIPPTALPETAAARALQPATPTEHVVTLQLANAPAGKLTLDTSDAHLVTFPNTNATAPPAMPASPNLPPAGASPQSQPPEPAAPAAPPA
jgi:hypothetical protein